MVHEKSGEMPRVLYKSAIPLAGYRTTSRSIRPMDRRRPSTATAWMIIPTSQEPFGTACQAHAACIWVPVLIWVIDMAWPP